MTVLFSDESCFRISRADRRTRVYRRRGERYSPNCVQVDQFGGDSVMVLAGFHHGGRTALVHVAVTLTNIRGSFHKAILATVDLSYSRLILRLPALIFKRKQRSFRGTGCQS